MSKEPAGEEARRLAGAAVDTLLNSGVALARGFAEAASGKPSPPLPNEPPLAAMIRHASAGIASIVRAAADGVKAGSATNELAEHPSGMPGLPVLTPGQQWRIPLSIDNRGAEPMTGLRPAVVKATHDGAPAEAPPVSFKPKSLVIAPHDFEKLVLILQVPSDAAEGEWAVTFTVGNDAPPSEIAYRVVRDQA